MINLPPLNRPSANNDDPNLRNENLAEAALSFEQALSDKATEEQARWWLDNIKRKKEKNKNI